MKRRKFLRILPAIGAALTAIKPAYSCVMQPAPTIALHSLETIVAVDPPDLADFFVMARQLEKLRGHQEHITIYANPERLAEFQKAFARSVFFNEPIPEGLQPHSPS